MKVITISVEFDNSSSDDEVDYVTYVDTMTELAAEMIAKRLQQFKNAFIVSRINAEGVQEDWEQ